MSQSIVIIDDDGITLDLIASIVEDAFDAIVYSYSDARHARTFITDQGLNSIDLIITDIEMPRYSGLDLLVFLRDKALSIPVLLVSAKSTKNIVVQAIKSGASGFIVKPFVRDDLIDKVSKILSAENK